MERQNKANVLLEKSRVYVLRYYSGIKLKSVFSCKYLDFCDLDTLSGTQKSSYPQKKIISITSQIAI